MYVLFEDSLFEAAFYYVFPMKWGDILFLAPSVCPSVRPSVCPSVTLSCPLYIF